MNKINFLYGLVLVSFFAACSTPDYAKRRSSTTKVFDNAARYGSIAAAAAGGGFGTYAVTKDPAASAVAAVGAGGLMYAFNRFTDSQQQDAYDTGVEDGANAFRAEMLRTKWEREAVFGLTENGSRGKRVPIIRQVRIPPTEQNGVLLEGGVQTVDFYP